ncbi:phosphoribosyl 1,2-cyclic phosphate phosphodiesterase [Hasllibacter halocynthiae]|uniref:Phosphoribosyl 1,2-cyclic phosphate phosphodiesterase n=1 Tax=Hasllibacter halocynthiae TaxID=595589 RepID=A0A2T0X6X7_9RHOB|nr:MBL fold metallo-hydrolase [Hasllibacter halocynthiae]PRY94711.1 phosphoribosyl 1,2-cyclic phosphate phosphodiesterase [Hasllibacter halocynthiae]
MTLRFTILGCGSSGGVPRLPDEWGECDPSNPKNRRRRCSLLVERVGRGGTTIVLVDTSPDLREQLLGTRTGRLDGVVWTHAHADHVHGIDDLRMIYFRTGTRIPCWADEPTRAALLARFGYAFAAPEGSPYPPICDLRDLSGPVEVDGPGGPIGVVPFAVDHGATPCLGLRIGGLAYVPDAVAIPDDSWPHLKGLDVLVVDALRRRPHPTHANLDLALDWIGRARPRRAVLTNMHVDLDHAAVDAETPEDVAPAHDGMTIELPVPPRWKT